MYSINTNKQIMDYLSLNELLEIYLGNSLHQGLEFSESKKLAYQEIQKRTEEYRKKNNISEIVSELNGYLENLNNILKVEKIYSMLFIDNSYGQEMYKLSEDVKLFCFSKYQSNSIILTKKIKYLTNKLDNLWENDPEHIKYSSTFKVRGTLSQSQEYYKNHTENVFFTKNKKWRYQMSAHLGFDHMSNIVGQSTDFDIVFLPISLLDWNINRKLIFNFIILFNAIKSMKSVLWILFINKTNSTNNIENILIDIRNFTRKLLNKSGFYFDLMPYSIIEQTIDRDLDLNEFTEKLDKFTDKYM